MTVVLPRGAEREYLAAHGIAAVYVATSPVVVGTSRDLAQTLLNKRRRFPDATIAAAYWVKDAATAQLLAANVKANLARAHDADTASRRIVAVARHLGIPITDHVLVLARCRVAVRHVDEMIETAQGAGELRWFNQSFRAWRLEANRQGRTMSYAEARARLRRAIFRQILLTPSDELGGLPEIFPPLDIKSLTV